MATPEENVATPAPAEAATVDAPAATAAVDATPKEVKKEGEKKDEGTLKLTLMISGGVVAAIGAIFAIIKKIKEEANKVKEAA